MAFVENIKRAVASASYKKNFIKLFEKRIDDQTAEYRFFGHFSGLHDRISRKRNSFNYIIKEINRANGYISNVEVGLSRYNFYCIDKIINLLLTLNGKERENILPFGVFPLDNIARRYLQFLKVLVSVADKYSIRIALQDKELPQIIFAIEWIRNNKNMAERELVRLLSVLVEHAFIGPSTVVVDLHHKCNIKCKHCFVHNPVIHHGREFLNRTINMSKLKEIVKDFHELKVDNVIIQGDGEPLMHRDFMRMVRYIRSMGIECSFFTNGTLLNDSKIRKIIEMGINEIFCSLPAGSGKSYRDVTTLGTEQMFQDIIDNLRRMMDIKRVKSLEKPRLIMTHVIHNMNCHELEDMARVDSIIGADATRFYLIRLDDNNQHLKLLESDLTKIRATIGIAERILRKNGIELIDNIKFQLENYDVKTGDWAKDIFLEKGCTIGWYFCLIPALLDMSMCCHLRTVGHLDKSDFKEIWSSNEYWDYRRRAKHLRDNMDFTFKNGTKLYDQHCERCDNHQTLIETMNNLKNLGLHKFYN